MATIYRNSHSPSVGFRFVCFEARINVLDLTSKFIIIQQKGKITYNTSILQKREEKKESFNYSNKEVKRLNVSLDV